MKASPAFQFYPADFLLGTATMTVEEVGAYIRLLCVQWSQGGLPADDARLAMIAQCNVGAIASVKVKFRKCPDGRLRNDRLEKVRASQDEYRRKQSENAGKRWHPDRNAETMPPHIPPDMPSHEPPHIPPDMPEGMPNGCSSSSSSSLSSSSSSSSGKEDGSIESSPASKRVVPDKDFLDGLAKDLAYEGIDVAREHAKMIRWCEQHRKQPTRRRLVNWLNRIEVMKVPEKTKLRNGSDW